MTETLILGAFMVLLLAMAAFLFLDQAWQDHLQVRGGPGRHFDWRHPLQYLRRHH